MDERDPEVSPFSDTMAPAALEDTALPAPPAGTEPQSPIARSKAPATELSGQHLAHFRIERKLGKGGMGEVYLATDLALQRPVAIKILSRDIAEDPDLRERFYREARAQARIQHPNVCHIYFIGQESGQLFFAMEYVDGESLQERLDREGKIPPGAAVELCRMAALGLREAHRHGFTHRDVKPSNLMVDRHGHVKVVDFGIAKQTGDRAAPAITREGAGTLIGTPLYMAPEQARGDAIDFRADIYALGATLHHLVAGAPPFQGSSDLAVISHHLSEPRPRLTPSRRLRESSPLDALCDRMMAKRATDRFASYDDLIAAMDQASPARSRPAGFWVRTFATGLDISFVLILLIAFKVPLSRWLGDMKAVDDVLNGLGITAYVVTCHVFWGRTLGKRLLELEIVSADGRRPQFSYAATRIATKWGLFVLTTVALFVDQHIIGNGPSDLWSIPFTAAVTLPIFAGIFAAWRSPRKRTVWDRLAGTEVRYATAAPHP